MTRGCLLSAWCVGTLVDRGREIEGGGHSAVPVPYAMHGETAVGQADETLSKPALTPLSPTDLWDGGLSVAYFLFLAFAQCPIRGQCTIITHYRPIIALL